MLDNISYWLGTWISPLRSLLSNYFQQKQVSIQPSQSLQTLNDFLFDIYMVLHSSSSQTKQHWLKTRYRYIICITYELFVAAGVSPPPPSSWSALLQHCSTAAASPYYGRGQRPRYTHRSCRDDWNTVGREMWLLIWFINLIFLAF